MNVSRREMLRSLLKRPRPSSKAVVPQGAPPLKKAPSSQPEVALIHQHFCLAWQGTFCTVCSERCPEAGAIVVEKGKPTVNTEHCTGCQVCLDVCPAPKKAIFTVAAKPKPGMNCDWGWERKEPGA